LPALVVDARLVPKSHTVGVLQQVWERSVTERTILALYSEGELAALILPTASLPPELLTLEQGIWTEECAAFSSELPRVESFVPRLRFLWEAVTMLGEAFAEVEAVLTTGVEPRMWQQRGVWILAPERVQIAPTADLAPGVVLDARSGPVFIDEGAIIQPGAVLLGPCAIGVNALVRAHATIGGYTVVGEGCRIGGEVAHSVFHAYANKQHEGFVGHSYVGEWVNLGAGTTTSNLKNTYGTVRLHLPWGEVDTGAQFLGTLCGDHTKTAIGTYLRTGAVIGISVNLLAGGMEARFVPSFSWGHAAQPQPYQVGKALEVARRVMARRGRELLPEEEWLLRAEYERVWGVPRQN